MAKRRVYLDYAASTPVDKKTLRAMMPYLKREYGNPSSSHSWGQASRAAVEEARSSVAELFGAEPGGVFFTSGATEANNLAIQGIIQATRYKLQDTKPHIVTSAIEHESVLEPIRELERRGEIEATYVGVGREGLVDPEEVVGAIGKNTVLVSVQYANSEIGTIQPVGQIGKLLEKYKIQDTRYKILFHTDAVQAVPFLDCSLDRLHADLLTASSHKIFGPKGAGALVARAAVSFKPLLWGGGQEAGARSGTENVAALAGFGAAARESGNGRSKIAAVKVRQLRDRLLRTLQRNVPDLQLTGSFQERLPGNIHVRVSGVEGRDLVMALDRKGIAVSTGSACAELTQEPSHVLRALGYSPQESLSAVRITIGKTTTAQEIEYAAKQFAAAAAALRKS